MSRHALAVVSALALGLSSVVPAAATASAAPGAPAPSPTGSSSPSSPAGAASTASNVSTDSTGVRVPAAVQKGVAGSVVDRTSTIRWTRCGTMQCATLTVPRDYADPSAGTIDLTVTRRPADRQGTGPEGRLGVLVTNPGGPGTAAAQTVPMFAQIVGRDVRARFDIIGINPRGTGDDQPAVCAGKPGQAMPDLLDWIFPTTAAQVVNELRRVLGTAVARHDRPTHVADEDGVARLRVRPTTDLVLGGFYDSGRWNTVTSAYVAPYAYADRDVQETYLYIR